MEITDNRISLMRSSALINDTIAQLQKGLGDLATMESQLRSKRTEIEHFLGQMIAQKLMLEQAQRDLK